MSSALSTTIQAENTSVMIYSGTVPLVSGHTIYGTSFRGQLSDPLSGQRLSFGYRVETLNYLRDSGAE